MHLSQETKEEIRSHSLEEQPKECCGLIIYDKEKERIRVLRCKNNSSSKKNHFEIHPRDYLRASLRGKILAMYHSHPNSDKSFSELDKYQSDGHRIDSVLYTVGLDSFKVYKAKKSKSSFWTKEFKINKNDCMTIVADFFEEELGIKTERKKIPADIKSIVEGREGIFGVDEKVSREQLREIFTNKNSGDAFCDFEFVCEYPFDDSKSCGHCVNGKCGGLKKYDILTIYLFDYLSHLAIYLEDNVILHHPRGGYPRIETLKSSLKKRTRSVVRHKSFLSNE